MTALGKLVITGSGRCGTGFVANVLTSLGFPCTHEGVFGPLQADMWRGQMADASWMALPYLEELDPVMAFDPPIDRVIHLVRNPIDVFNSLMGIRFFDPAAKSMHGPYVDFALSHAGARLQGRDIPDLTVLADAELSTVAWMAGWMGRCDRVADATVRVEEVGNPQVWRELAFPDFPVTDQALKGAVAQFTGFNHRNRAEYTYETAPSSLTMLARDYGYATTRVVDIGRSKVTVTDFPSADDADNMLVTDTPLDDPPTILVIVPTVSSRDNLATLVNSFNATKNDTTEMLVVVDNDVPEAHLEFLDHAGVRRYRHDGSFAVKVNAGYQLYQGGESEINGHEIDAVFVCGDDVNFHPGWVEALIATRAATGALVIGANDLGTQSRLKDGTHATHWLIDTDYIDTQGASWNTPGLIAHEGYRHWYVDDEIVTKARDLGVWAWAEDAIVEHLHPLYDKAEWDDTYQVGKDHAWADGLVWKLRRHLYSRETARA